MGLENLVKWTKDKLSQWTGGDVPVTIAGSLDGLTSGRVATPALDVFENESELCLVLDVPGAAPGTTHLAWDERDTLSVHVQRSANPSGVQVRCEYEESDWYREVVLPPEADGARAHSKVRDGVLTVRVPKRRTRSSKLIPVYAG